MNRRADVKRLMSTKPGRGGPHQRSTSRRRPGSTRREWAVLGVDTSGLIPAPQPATEAEAMGLPPFGRAVVLLANALASTSWYARREDAASGLFQRLPDQPEIVTNPNPLSTVWNYRWSVAEDGILYGNHFALPGDLDWRTGRPGWLVPIPADDVWIMTDPAAPGWYEWAIGGALFAPDDIFHVSFGSRSGEVLGRGVLEQYGDWLGGAVSAEDYSRDQFAAGALPPAVIMTNQAATQAQADELEVEVARHREEPGARHLPERDRAGTDRR